MTLAIDRVNQFDEWGINEPAKPRKTWAGSENHTRILLNRVGMGDFRLATGEANILDYPEPKIVDMEKLLKELEADEYEFSKTRSRSKKIEPSARPESGIASTDCAPTAKFALNLIEIIPLSLIGVTVALMMGLWAALSFGFTAMVFPFVLAVLLLTIAVSLFIGINRDVSSARLIAGRKRQR